MDLSLDKIWEYIGMTAALLGSVYSISLLIPGEQPDKMIKWLMDLTERLSRK